MKFIFCQSPFEKFSVFVENWIKNFEFLGRKIRFFGTFFWYLEIKDWGFGSPKGGKEDFFCSASAKKTCPNTTHLEKPRIFFACLYQVGLVFESIFFSKKTKHAVSFGQFKCVYVWKHGHTISKAHESKKNDSREKIACKKNCTKPRGRCAFFLKKRVSVKKAQKTLNFLFVGQPCSLP